MNQYGTIKVITGSMFAGKTHEILRQIRRSEFSNITSVVFKPLIDTRDGLNTLQSHIKEKYPCVQVQDSQDLMSKVQDFHDLIIIDEAQFFDQGIIQVVLDLSKTGKDIVLAGLDMDYLGRPFGPMPYLMSIADKVQKLHAICRSCNKKAVYSKRLDSGKDIILLGHQNEYEPRCRKCYFEK